MVVGGGSGTKAQASGAPLATPWAEDNDCGIGGPEDQEIEASKTAVVFLAVADYQDEHNNLLTAPPSLCKFDQVHMLTLPNVQNWLLKGVGLRLSWCWIGGGGPEQAPARDPLATPKGVGL